MDITLTRHADVRCQQRAIPTEFLGLVILHGSDAGASHGAVAIRFDKRAARSARADGIPTGIVHRLDGVTLILRGDTAITAWRDRSRASSVLSGTRVVRNSRRRLASLPGVDVDGAQ